MSRHIFETTYKGANVRVLFGWDRPLQGFFLTVEDLTERTDEIDEDEDEDMGFIFNNLDCTVSHPKSMTPFLRVLSNLGIELPHEMLLEIESDGNNNMGNKEVAHIVKDGAYIREVHYEEGARH